MSPMEPFERIEINGAELADRFPPRIDHVNKRMVFAATEVDARPPEGVVGFSRWPARELPAECPPLGEPDWRVEADRYTYPEPAADAVEWHVNFADPHLFVAYGGPLFAQDEIQVAEHPGLASVREMLLATGEGRPLTVEGGRPTPVLVSGVERRCEVATNADPTERRPNGLYGNEFAKAERDSVLRATKPLVPPTRSNILAMAAPSGGTGHYSAGEIEEVLVTAYSGFAAAKDETTRLAAARDEDDAGGGALRTVIHTGFWGCGAFGGNRTLMPALQLVAAHLAGVDTLVFHAFDEAGREHFDQARSLAEELLGDGGAGRTPRELVEHLADRGFTWGVSDGN